MKQQISTFSRIWTCVLAALIFAGVAPGIANAMTFSIDWQGPTAGGVPGPFTGIPDSFTGIPIDEGSILTPFFPGPPGPNPPAFGPLLPPGMMVHSLAGSPFGSVPGGLGIVTGPPFGGVELDALSYGRDDGIELFFSVDEWAIGLPGPAPPNVFTEGAFGAAEASADVFAYLGLAIPTPPGPVIGNTAVVDGDGVASFGGPGSGLIEPNPPLPGPDSGDNLDAVDLDTTLADVTGPIYFSLDSLFVDPLEGVPNTGTAFGNGFSGGDVLVSTPGGVPAVFIPAPILGLDFFGTDTDDLDALALLDVGTVGVFEPGIDKVLFSVRRGSAVIGLPDSAFGVPIEEGDVLSLPAGFTPFPSIFIAAEALGLATARSGATPFGFGDDLDALDILDKGGEPIPEPSTLVLFVVGILGVLGYGWRRRRKAA